MELAGITHDAVRIEGTVVTCPDAHITGNNVLFAWDYYRPHAAGISASRVTVNLTPDTGRGVVAVMMAHPKGGDVSAVEWKEFEEGADLNQVLDVARQYMVRLNAHPCRADEANEAWAYLYDRGYKVERDASIEGNRHGKDAGKHLSAFVRGVLHVAAGDGGLVGGRPDIVRMDDECEAGLYDHRDGTWSGVRCKNVEEAVFILENGLLPAPRGAIEHHDIESILPAGPKH